MALLYLLFLRITIAQKPKPGKGLSDKNICDIFIDSLFDRAPSDQQIQLLLHLIIRMPDQIPDDRIGENWCIGFFYPAEIGCFFPTLNGRFRPTLTVLP